MGAVIGSLLLGNEQIDLIEAQPTSDQELLQAVQAALPHIVILDDTLHEYLARLLSYMQQSEALRVVVVSADSNRVEVYHKQGYLVHQKSDLFAVL